jgi:hypothetical protein
VRVRESFKLDGIVRADKRDTFKSLGLTTKVVRARESFKLDGIFRADKRDTFKSLGLTTMR